MLLNFRLLNIQKLRYESVSLVFFVIQPQMVAKPIAPNAIPAILPVSSSHLHWVFETVHLWRDPQLRPHKVLHWSANATSNNIKIVITNSLTSELPAKYGRTFSFVISSVCTQKNAHFWGHAFLFMEESSSKIIRHWSSASVSKDIYFLKKFPRLPEIIFFTFFLQRSARERIYQFFYEFKQMWGENGVVANTENTENTLNRSVKWFCEKCVKITEDRNTTLCEII